MNKIKILILAAALLTGGCHDTLAAQFSKYRKPVSDLMMDPDSTVFRKEKVSSSGVYCAELNSKNSYGGYVGFQRVISGLREGDSARYVFLKKEGVLHNGSTHGKILSVMIEAKALRIKLLILESLDDEKAARGEALSEEAYQLALDSVKSWDYKQMALRDVFEEEWAASCTK